MKKLFLIAAIGLMAIPTFAQETSDDKPIRSLIGNGQKIKHGGWGAPFASYSQILDQDAVFIGLRGGWLINHRLTIGVAGSGLVSSIKNQAYDAFLEEDNMSTESDSRFRVGYGGLLIEPVLFYSSPVHISLPIIIGAGGASYSTFYDWDENNEWDESYHNYFNNTNSFFVIEPGVDLELNVIPLLRVGIGASYRYTSGLEMDATPKDALDGWNGTLSIKIGSF